jgi:pyruvate dehydrogenase E2 component (dihydrolipoamide acetyltransferase)
MSVLKDFALPDLGEGLTESEIVSWHVDVGDTVTLNQIIADVETAKALVELPSPYAGVVNRLCAEPGTTVQVGTPIVTFEIDEADAPGSDESEPGAGEPGEPPAPESVPAEGEAAGRQSVLVGYGPKIETGERPRRRQRGAAAAEVQRHGVGSAGGTAERPRSTPPVRKLARDLGIDIASVRGTGERGLITREDVQAVADSAGHAVGSGAFEGEADRRVAVAGVRKATAAAMVSSAFTAPHVTEFLTVDVTETMELLESLRLRQAFRQSRLNILTIVSKALCIAVRRTPEVNAHWEDRQDGSAEIIEHAAVNLGIAAATPRGLLVPNIAGADRLGLAALADAIGDLVATARAGRTAPAQLTGGTITITNVGVFGIDAGTPIINPGEAAILAMGAVRKQPWEYRGEIALRQVMTLSLSFDHRMVDGEQGSRFLADIGAILAEPGVVLAMV